jgi:hypothetical protein
VWFCAEIRQVEGGQVVMLVGVPRARAMVDYSPGLYLLPSSPVVAMLALWIEQMVTPVMVTPVVVCEVAGATRRLRQQQTYQPLLRSHAAAWWDVDVARVAFRR